jgi:hypothetical protein
VSITRLEKPHSSNLPGEGAPAEARQRVRS